ncbi:MAG: TetR/AcrR family transcriptional regulator [Treponema sp.]|nr:TetR/AcrR family transcriptional regulator [Treponema sp.]
MRKANVEIMPLIKQRTLELLMKKNPEEIGMRDIAENCGITATSIYHYYKDKDKLFQAISLDCLYKLNDRIKEAAKNGNTIKKQIKNAIKSFRDWCFENPRLSLLVMEGIKSADDATQEIIEQYYVCNRTGEDLLRKAVAQGEARSENPRLDIGILISGLWGCIESIILKKSEPEYWEDGKEFTDRFIKIWMKSIFINDKND